MTEASLVGSSYVRRRNAIRLCIGKGQIIQGLFSLDFLLKSADEFKQAGTRFILRFRRTLATLPALEERGRQMKEEKR